MQVVCLDLEGVLVPEIWIAFSERTGIAEFRRTTREEPDYDKLMSYRLGLLRQHGLKLADICLLYTSDAADERSSVDLGGSRILKKKKTKEV